MIDRLRSKPARLLGLALGWTAIVGGSLTGSTDVVGFWLFTAAWTVVTALVIWRALGARGAGT